MLERVLGGGGAASRCLHRGRTSRCVAPGGEGHSKTPPWVEATTKANQQGQSARGTAASCTRGPPAPRGAESTAAPRRQRSGPAVSEQRF